MGRWVEGGDLRAEVLWLSHQHRPLHGNMKMEGGAHLKVPQTMGVENWSLASVEDPKRDELDLDDGNTPNI